MTDPATDEERGGWWQLHCDQCARTGQRNRIGYIDQEHVIWQPAVG